MDNEYKYFNCMKLLNYLRVKDLYSFHYLICFKMNGKINPEMYTINKNLANEYIDSIKELETYNKKLNNINLDEYYVDEEISSCEIIDKCPCKKMKYYISNFGDIYV